MGCFSFLIMSLLLAFIWNHVKALSISVKCFMVPFLANGVSGAFYFHENCFLLGTIAKCHLHGSDLLVQQHFRWVQLRWDGEPMRGLLQRILRRKVINKVRTQISFSSYINHLVCEIYMMVMPKTEQITSVVSGKQGILFWEDAGCVCGNNVLGL